MIDEAKDDEVKRQEGDEKRKRRGRGEEEGREEKRKRGSPGGPRRQVGWKATAEELALKHRRREIMRSNPTRKLLRQDIFKANMLVFRRYQEI